MKGLIESYDVAIDPTSGRLVVVACVGNNIYVVSRTGNGYWQKPAVLDPKLRADYKYDVSVHSGARGAFTIRIALEGVGEWFLRAQ